MADTRLIVLYLLLGFLHVYAFVLSPTHITEGGTEPLTKGGGHDTTSETTRYSVEGTGTYENARFTNVDSSKTAYSIRSSSTGGVKHVQHDSSSDDDANRVVLMGKPRKASLGENGDERTSVNSVSALSGALGESLTFETPKQDRRSDALIDRKRLGDRVPCKMDKSMRVADCSNLDLDQVPRGLPTDLLTLILSGNKLTNHSLTNGTFKRYGQLRDLLLDANNISSLPEDAFVGLHNLGVLNLHSNGIVMDSSLNQSTAFVPVKNTLFKLSLINNTKNVNAPGLMYPDKALSYLTNIHTLELDGLPSTAFGYHFQYLTSLTRLSLEGYYKGKCNLSSFQNNTFQYTPTIRYLVIADCKLYKNKIQANALAPLTRLEFLDVSYNFDLGLDGLGNLLYGQRNNKNLKGIFMKYIVQRYEPCIVLYKDILNNIRNLNLEYVDATHNNIEMIEYGAIEYLPQTLKRVNLTRNNIMFGAYWRHMRYMTSLESLDLNGFDQAFRIPSRTPPANIHCPPHSEGQGNGSLIETIPERREEFPGPLKLQLPPFLVNLTMRSSSLAYKIDAMIFDTRNSLKLVDLHGNFLPELNGPISGLHKLEVLDISSSYVRQISSNFLWSMKSLRYLNLRDNVLGESLSKQSSIIASDSLRELNLGDNGIFSFNKGLFSNCSKLSTLVLSENRIGSIGSALDNLPNLRRLYLSQNDITTLPESLRNHFSKMKGHVQIDMSYNPIHCDCNSIDFLDWVVRTKIFGSNYTHYYCIHPGEQYKKMLMSNGYDEELKILLNECANNTKLFICVISATVAFFLILLGVILYRFRWTMQYWYYVAKVMLISKSSHSNIEDLEYDLFVCYCHQDNRFITEELEVKLGEERDVRLLLQEKCLQAGQKIAESILAAVRQSKKTLIVMSKSMLDSDWCSYQLEMARQESISTGRTVLVILFLEEIPKATMSLDMVNYIKSNVSVTYPVDHPERRDAFWDKLARDLQAS